MSKNNLDVAIKTFQLFVSSYGNVDGKRPTKISKRVVLGLLNDTIIKELYRCGGCTCSPEGDKQKKIKAINIETEEQFEWMVREMRGQNKCQKK